MTPLIFDSEAESELRAAIAWYEQERVGLGDEFWAEVQQVLKLIEDHPGVGGIIAVPAFEARHGECRGAASHTS